MKLKTLYFKLIMNLRNLLSSPNFLKEDYASLKEFTIDRFYHFFSQSIETIINAKESRDYLKGAISDYSCDEEEITFKFLFHKIHLRYKINLHSQIIIEAYKEELDIANYPHIKLAPITELNFSFSQNPDSNGLRGYEFKRETYSSSVDAGVFLKKYLETLQNHFFPKPTE